MAAAKANYWQRGETIDFLNDTNAKIEANTVVLLGKRIGIAGTDIAAKSVGTLHVTGVYKFPKATGEVTVGALVYWDAAANNITTTEASNTLAGFAVEAAGNDDDTVTVKINA